LGKIVERDSHGNLYFPSLTLKNFQTLISQVPFFLYVRNSLIFAIGTTFAPLLVSFLAAYAFARIQFAGSGVIL
jgi:sn-glycerol 3-phosphate transport system permease protein